MYTKIIATGSYLPEKILSNQELSTMVETSDEWITSRSGIKERHIIAEEEKVSHMAYKASIDAIDSNNIDKNTIDMIIVATFSPDTAFPAVACLLQKKLQLHNIPAFDLNAACTGFIYALATADAFIKTAMAKTILIVGVDAASHYIDFTDRNTCVLFGDGAGAVIVRQSNSPGIIASKIYADGSGEDALNISGQVKNGTILGRPYIQMDGKKVFRMAVKNLADVSEELLFAANYTKEQISWLVPHQANIRIIQATAEALSIPMEKVIVTVDKHGNTAAASVPLALDYAVKNGKIKVDDVLLLKGVGAGYTWGASLIVF